MSAIARPTHAAPTPTPLAWCAMLVFALSACTSFDKPAEIAPPAPPETAVSRQRDAAVAAELSDAAPAGSISLAGSVAVVTVPGATAQATADMVAPSASMLIRTGTASVRVDSLELAITALRQVAATLGGTVGNASLTGGDHQLRSASLELRIPAARYDDAIVGLRPLGTVESVNTTAQDVGEEYVDLEARVANAKRLEERLITLLATRTGKLEDVLSVERELARVREETERHEGRLRFLRTRVATSTLVVTVHEPVPLVASNPGEHIIADAFVQAWRSFMRTIAALIASLGVVIPLGVLVAGGVMGWRRLRRRAATTPAVA
jgi:hypothetical protein